MSASDHLNDEQFERHALGVLQRELGAAGLARFLRLNRSGSGDYTEERGNWLQGQELNEVLDSMRAKRDSADR